MKRKEYLLNQLSEYTQLLNKALKETTIVEDRVKYQRHLACVSIIFASLIVEDIKTLRSILDDEERSFGLNYLVGEMGRSVEEKFNLLNIAINDHIKSYVL